MNSGRSSQSENNLNLGHVYLDVEEAMKMGDVNIQQHIKEMEKKKQLDIEKEIQRERENQLKQEERLKQQEL